MQLQDFLNKARENESKKLKIIEIEVEGFGKIEFSRPTVNELVEYTNKVAGAVTTIQTDEGTIKRQSYEDVVQASKELVYNSCSLLQASETRDNFKGLSPYDIPLEVFGITKTIELATEISDKFDPSERIKKMEDDIKNLSDTIEANMENSIG